MASFQLLYLDSPEELKKQTAAVRVTGVLAKIRTRHSLN